jgi:pimeloyl-ACP methyl ester carboxylesterase
MRSHSAKLRWILMGILVAGILLWNPFGRIFVSVRLARSLHSLALGASGESLPVKTAEIRVQNGDQVYRALSYYPSKSPPARAVILLAGLSELGCDHPRLIAFSRHLADLGLMVITPDLREYRNFQLSAAPITQILFWHKRIPSLEGGDKVQAIGIAGISFSGTIALMAAADPEIRQKAAFVVAIGPYFDLARCARYWFSPSPQAPPGISYGGKFYAKWIIMRAALDMMKENKDRIFLHNVLNALLLQNKLMPVDPDLTAEGKRWYALAAMPGTYSDPELSEEIENRLASAIYSSLNPEKALEAIACPVYIIHGADDDLIPAKESLDLHQSLRRSHLLITPFISHTQPSGDSLSFKKKTKALLDMAIFGFHLSRVIE